MMFKIFLFIFNLLPVLVLSVGHHHPNFTENIEQCATETNATRDDIMNIRHHEIPETRTEECLLACIQKRIGFMNDDNTINLANILKSMEHVNKFGKMKKIYEDCKVSEITENDACTAAKKYAECVFPREKELGPPPRSMGLHGRPHGPYPPGGPMGPPPRPPTRFQPDVEECQNQTGATTDEVLKILKHGIPESQNERCMLACTLKKWTFIGDDNKIDLEKIKKRFEDTKDKNPYIYTRTIDMHIECKKIETDESDECLAAQKYAECIFPKVKMSQLPPVFRKHIEDCQNKTNATDMEIYSTITEKGIPTTTPASCMLACMQKTSGMMNPDNTIAIDKIKENFRHFRFQNDELYNKLIKSLEDCKAQESKDDDECLAAKKFSECFTPIQSEFREAAGPPHRF